MVIVMLLLNVVSQNYPVLVYQFDCCKMNINASKDNTSYFINMKSFSWIGEGKTLDGSWNNFEANKNV